MFPRFLPELLPTRLRISFSILALLLTWVICPLAANAQSLQVVASCGTLPSTPPVGSANGPITVDQTGKVCANVSVSASVSPFAPAGNFATVTSTASSADHAIPSGSPTVVALFNTGTTAVSCTLTVGAGTAVANENIIQASSWIGVSVGSNTHFSCINQAGDSASNVVVASGGSGLPSGSGGGGGGSSSTVTANQGTAGASAWPVNATLQASATTAIGKVDPNTLGSWGLVAVGGTPPANVLQIGGTSIAGGGGALTPWNVSGTGVGQVAFATGNVTSWNGTILAAATAWGTNPSGNVIGANANLGAMGGTAINSGCVSNYGTAPSAVACPSTNAYVTNTLPAGQAVKASSSPVVIASDQTLPWTGSTGATAPTSASLGGLIGATSDPTAVTNGQMVGAEATPNGKIIVQPWALTPNLASGGGSATGTGTFTILAASGSASLKEYLTGIQCGRSDAGTTAITVAISDGTTTRTFVVPDNGGGGGNNAQFTTPMVFAANTAVTAAFSSGVTTGYCNAEGYYAP